MKTIPLTQGKVALVDDEDFERLNQFKWCLYRHKHTFYAYRQLPKVNGKQKTIFLHREVIFAPPNVEVDHRDGNGLDNRKDNLRLASSQQNKMNRRKRIGLSSQFKGVSWDRQRNEWRAKIQFSRQSIHLGRFESEHDAARAYDIAARKHFGEFAKLNF